MSKIREAVKVNCGKLVYVIQLTTDSGHEKLQLYFNDGNDYGKPGIKFEDNAYSFDRYNVFDIRSEGHRVAKEIFLTHLQAEVKTKLLELKQLELVLDELGLVGVMRKTISENATILLNVKDEIIEKKTSKKVLKTLEKNRKENEKIIDAKIEEQAKITKKEIDKSIEEQVRPIARKKSKNESRGEE